MSRRRKLFPAPNDAPAVAVPALTGSAFAERVLVAALVALVVARALVAGDDPGQLRLTSGSGPLILNALTFFLLLSWSVWRGWTRRAVTGGAGWIAVAGLLLAGALAFASAAGPERYRRPGWFIAWDWVALAALCFLVWQLATTEMVRLGLVAAFLATAVSVAAQALYQEAARGIGLPSTEIDPLPKPAMQLVGDDEYGTGLDGPPSSRGSFRATFSRPDTLAGFLLLLLPTGVVFALTGWRGGVKVRAALVVPIVIVVGLGFAAVSWLVSAAPGADGWRAAGDELRTAPLLGVGPGNFTRRADAVAAPGSFWLGLAATAGLVTLAVVAITVVVVAVLGFQRREGIEPSEPPPRSGPRWEFYGGGVAGLLLGMMLATGEIPPEAAASELLRLGAVAAGRAVVWFVAFGLLENINPGAMRLRRALLFGVVLVALLGVVSDGLASPSLAQPFWLAATLALAGPGRSAPAPTRSLPLAWAGVPPALALLVANLIHVGVPGYTTASAGRGARLASKEFPHRQWKIEGLSGADRTLAVRDADNYLLDFIVQPMREALAYDPDNSALLIQLAKWDRWHWRHLQELKQPLIAEREGRLMLARSERAAHADPRNLTAKLTTFDTLMLFASESSPVRGEQLKALDKVIDQIAERDARREVALRYRVVFLLLTKKYGEPVDAWAL
jgi:hypothetical protein